MAKRWTDDDDFRLTEMRDEGVSYKQIGIQLGRSEHACAQRGFKLGITKKRSGSLPIDLPTYIDDETEVPADFMWRRESTEWNVPKTKPKPAWWTAMMWWR
jgi:hypothetical protein